MKSTPSLSNHNRFSVLSVDSIEIDESVDEKVVHTLKNVPIGSTHKKARTFRPQWERKLPTRLVVNMLGSEETSRSLKLKITLETTDTGETKSVNALLDSGATGMFISRDYVKANRLTTRSLSTPIPVYNVDGTPNEAGSIT